MKKKIIFAAACGLLALSLFTGCSSGATQNTINNEGSQQKGPTVVLHTQKGGTDVSVEIADTMPERTKGLMYRKALPPLTGMFFIFDKEEPLQFWMKNTLIPLDMVFFDSAFKVVKIVRNAQPCRNDPCEVFPSDEPAKYVLEVNAGTGDKSGLKTGDSAELKI